MGQDREVEPLAQRDQLGQVFGRDPFQRTAEPVARLQIEHRPHQQRVEELHAELAVPGPDFAILIGADREVIDEHRLHALELDIVGRGIAQREAIPQQRKLHVEMGQRRGLVQAEAPLVWIGNERDARVRKNHPGIGKAKRRGLIGHVGEIDQLARIGQAAQHA